MTKSKFKTLTDVQRIYFSHLLTLKRPKWEVDSSSDALIEAKVDPIPHQVEAAQFVFRNPFQGGVILGDEVGLGKTIETGLVLSQLWAEGKRKILIIAPKSLRHQWQDELRNLFYLDGEIIDTKSYSMVEKGIYPDPMTASQCILITNEHFVAKYETKISKTHWDLVVIDEAHKLRNVWKPAKNQAKRAKSVRSAIQNFKKLLLTATPMQNNLMELYGLSTFLDPYALGTAESFKRNFISINEEELEEKLDELKARISKFFKRELRQNVQSFIPYTNRNAVTIPFDPTDNEEELRIAFENYLKDPNTVALPPIANGFLRLVYFKLLSSSSFALKNSLNNLYIKLIYNCILLDDKLLYEQLMSAIQKKLILSNGNESQELIKFKKALFKNVINKTFEGLRSHLEENLNFTSFLKEEGAEENYDDEDLEQAAIPEEEIKTSREKIQSESELILGLIDLSRQITKNSKGAALVHALEQQFKRAKENNWPEKAVIFTEFKTTQDYVISVLEQSGLNIKEDIVIFNGDSGTAEERRQLIEDFKENKKIFLTTEAGAEGLNLQFCNLIINYDLPWNPQRIEQRIGRCHRYGQKLDVIVVNFANKRNVADQRILELLKIKFQLFEGAFGASNTVLGEIESGTDIEKEILKIYLSCRTEEEISSRFEELLNGNSEEREQKFAQAKEIILKQFDEEVQSKLKSLEKTIKTEINRKTQLVKDVILSSLPECELHEQDDSFKSGVNNIGLDPLQRYSFSREEGFILVNHRHPAFEEIKKLTKKNIKMRFNYTGNHNISMVESLVGESGTFAVYKATLSGLETKEVLVPIFKTRTGNILQKEVGDKILTVQSEEVGSTNAELKVDEFSSSLNDFVKEEFILLQEYNEDLYNEEIDRLDSYFEDLQELRKREIADIENEMSKLKKERRKLKLDQTREVNIKIQRLKSQIIKKEEEITQLRKEASDKEKHRLKELNDLSEIKIENELLAFGEFEII